MADKDTQGVSIDEILEEAKSGLGQDALPEDAVRPGRPYQPRRRNNGDGAAIKKAAARLWLVSFTDLFSLLLVFFVMLYSLKDPDMNKIGKISGTTAKNMYSSQDVGFAGGTQQEANIARVEYGEALGLDYLHGVLKRMLDERGLDRDVDMQNGSDFITLHLQDVASGTGLGGDGSRVVGGVGDGLSRLPNRITVIAYARDWDSGLARAQAVAAAVKKAGYRKPMGVLCKTSGDDGSVDVRVEADNGRIR